MENRIGLNSSYIGVGQCGGNIANDFSKLFYKSIAINTSITDLERLSHINKNNRLLINVGIQGAGKNPEIGRKALEEHIEEVMHLIDQVFDNTTDIIYICAGLGGGTGSGIAPLLAQILLEQGHEVGMIVTIPSEIESSKVKIVALNAFEEISKLENLSSIFVVDNAKATKLPSQMGIKTKYSIVNENIAAKFHEINRMTTYASDMAFDARDFQTLIGTRGSASITSIQIDDIDELKSTETLAQSVKKALENSIYADTNYVQAKGCAFLFELPNGGGHYITEEALGKMQKELGTPFEVFTGVYENKNRSRNVSLHILVTGLPFPFERLNKIENDLEEQANNIQSKIEQSQKQTFSSNGKALLNKFISPTTAPKVTKPTTGESTLDKLLKKKKNA